MSLIIFSAVSNFLEANIGSFDKISFSFGVKLFKYSNTFLGSETARIVNWMDLFWVETFTVSKKASDVDEWIADGISEIVSRNWTIGDDACIPILAKRSLRSFKHLYTEMVSFSKWNGKKILQDAILQRKL